MKMNLTNNEKGVLMTALAVIDRDSVLALMPDMTKDELEFFIENIASKVEGTWEQPYCTRSGEPISENQMLTEDCDARLHLSDKACPRFTTQELAFARFSPT